MSKRTLMVFCLFAAGFGCSSEPELPKVDCATVATVPTYSQVSIFQVCNQCHSTAKTGADRHDADTDVNFDTYSVAKSSAEDAAAEVNGGDMPPKDPGIELRAITDDEKTALYQWALCGTPQ
jgi:uncharacterized membrane protein